MGHEIGARSSFGKNMGDASEMLTRARWYSADQDMEANKRVFHSQLAQPRTYS
jgi:hypothetical protein